MGSSVAALTQVSLSDQIGRKTKAFEVNYDGKSVLETDLTSLPGGFYFLWEQSN